MREATWKLNLSHIVFADRGWGAPFSRWGLRVINDITLIWIVILIAVGRFIVSCPWSAYVARDPGSGR